MSGKTAATEVVDGQAGLEDEGGWFGPPISFSHGFDRYWAGFAGNGTVTLPTLMHPRARAAAEHVVRAQEHLRGLQAELVERRQEAQELPGRLADESDDVIEARLSRVDARIAMLERARIPAAQNAVEAALQEFSAAYHTTRGELNAHIIEKLVPAALQAARSSVGAVLSDLRKLAELEAALNGDGTLARDQHDAQAATAAFERNLRVRAVDTIGSGYDLPGVEGRLFGLPEIVSGYSEALTAKPAPEVEVQAEPDVDFREPGSEEAWKIRNRILAGVATGADPGTGRPAA